MQLPEIITRFSKRAAALAGRAEPESVRPQVLDCVRFPYGPFQIKFRVPRGANYFVEATTDLKTWIGVANDVAGTDTLDYVDSDASKMSYRFYRLSAGDLFAAEVVGYASITLPPGFSMIANPLLHRRSDMVGELMKDMPEETTLNRYDTRLFRLNENVFKDGKWKNPAEKLSPGEGAILFNPTSDYRTLNFVGNVPQGQLFNPIAAGFSIRSSLVPQPGRLDTDLGFPIAEGDTVHIFDRDRQQYSIFPYDPKKWAANAPVVGIGEAFWVAKTEAANWTRLLNLLPARSA